MSKQPGTGNGMLSRLRRPAVGLRDLTIWSKLGLIMIVPTLATVIVGANGLIGHVQAARDADRARSLATLAEASGDLVHGLQDERAAAVILLGTSNQAAKQTRLAAYRGTHAAVNAARTCSAAKPSAGCRPTSANRSMRSAASLTGWARSASRWKPARSLLVAPRTGISY